MVAWSLLIVCRCVPSCVSVGLLRLGLRYHPHRAPIKVSYYYRRRKGDIESTCMAATRTPLPEAQRKARSRNKMFRIAVFVGEGVVGGTQPPPPQS